MEPEEEPCGAAVREVYEEVSDITHCLADMALTFNKLHMSIVELLLHVVFSL